MRRKFTVILALEDQIDAVTAFNYHFIFLKLIAVDVSSIRAVRAL